MAGDRQFQYSAFLCYSRGLDGDLATTVRNTLQDLGRPWYKVRELRVFHDTTVLAANPNLWGAVQQGLDESEFLILLASPQAAASMWVQREIEHWLRTKGPEKILIALTGGEIAWDGRTADFDWTTTTALPLLLRGVFRAEPRWVDLRPLRALPKSAHKRAFQLGAAPLAAALHHTTTDQVLREDGRQLRRNRVIALGSAVVTLVLALALFAVVFVVQAPQRPADGGVDLALTVAFVTIGVVGGGGLSVLVVAILVALVRPPLRAIARWSERWDVEPGASVAAAAQGGESDDRRSVFISYRRSDERYAAHRLYDFLVARFDKAKIFIDVDKIHPGTDFVLAINSAISRTKVLVVIVGADWIGRSGPLRRSRIKRAADYVRVEAETALGNRQIVVIPVLVDTEMPPARSLPKTLRPLLRRQAFALHIDNFWSVCDQLESAISSAMAEAPESNPTSLAHA